MRNLLLVFLGGGLGSICRYLVNRWITNTIISPFQYGTFLVNVTGCFLIGFFIFFTERSGHQTVPWRLFLVTGFCGGYTTFSSFAFENIQYMSNYQLLLLFVYLVSSIAIGLLATYMGILLARNI